MQNEWLFMPSHDLSDLASKLDMCGKALESWSRAEVGDLQSKISFKEKELSSRLQGPIVDNGRVEISRCKKDLDELYRQDETF